MNSKAGFLQPVNSEGFSAIHSMLLLEWYTHPLRWSEITKKPSPLTHTQSHYRLHFLKLKKSKWRTKPPVSPYNLEGKRGVRAESQEIICIIREQIECTPGQSQPWKRIV